MVDLNDFKNTNKATRHDFSADGLRGIAAANVAISHFIAAFLPSVLHSHYPDVFQKNLNPSLLFQFIEHPLVSIFYNGHFAVVIFFVLSGYVLVLPYWSMGGAILLVDGFGLDI
jgi:peptidoglycan/LPS O-acetylase OafA/YrhL